MRNWKLKKSQLDHYPVYQGDDLGIIWHKDKTNIRIWAPTAIEVLFRLYLSADASSPSEIINMSRAEEGTWIARLEGDREGVFYTIQVCDVEGWLDEHPDIYAKATGVNGLRGLIIDLEKTKPPRWTNDKRCLIRQPTDMVIYELHIRDFSISPSSGITLKGKYLGVAEKNCRSLQGLTTGLDHLIELGITHVHLLPVSDFYTVDETKEISQYNWGYDPLNYNTPEGWYATNASDGYTRIRELKMMVQELHKEGIGVILDVVYNHTGLIFDSWFNQTVPGYFYRQEHDGTLSDASGCGNEIASEREMVRKFIVNSVIYWAKEYHIDGFRFDLMGILDIKTMNLIRSGLDLIDPTIFMYGEGWIAAPSPLSEEKRAVKLNTKKLHRIASFCDDMRDGLKGSPFHRFSKGFISGLTLREEQLKFSIVGAIQHPQIIYDYVDTSKVSWANSPGQCVNYVTCHDNYTLYDKLQYACSDSTDEEIEKMTRLAIGIILTAQGVPFLHAGVEMHRSKEGHHDSYRSPDSVNQIDWNQKFLHQGLFNFTKECIRLRKSHPAFRINDPEMVRNKLFFYSKYIPGVIAYELRNHANGDVWKTIAVLFNGNNYHVDYPIPTEKWQIIAENSEFLINNDRAHPGKEITLPPISMTILAVID